MRVKELKEYIQGLNDDCEIMLWDSQEKHFQFIEKIEYAPQNIIYFNDELVKVPTLHIIGNGRAPDDKISKDAR